MNPDENPDDDSDFQNAGGLTAAEAGRILPRLEKDGVRFEIDTDLFREDGGFIGGFSGEHIALYVHRDDFAAWEKIRAEYFPV